MSPLIRPYCTSILRETGKGEWERGGEGNTGGGRDRDREREQGRERERGGGGGGGEEGVEEGGWTGRGRERLFARGFTPIYMFFVALCSVQKYKWVVSETATLHV